MNSFLSVAEKDELITRLRSLAYRLEHDMPMQYRWPGQQWKTLGDDPLSSILSALRRIRPTPVPLEEWKVLYDSYATVLCSTLGEAEQYAKKFPAGFLRIVHMREVTE